MRATPDSDRPRRRDKPSRSESDSERDERRRKRQYYDRQGSSRHDDRSYRRRSRSNPPQRDSRDQEEDVRPSKRRDRSRSRSPVRRSKAPLPSQNDSFRGETGVTTADQPPPKQKPNYKPTGLLAKEANTVVGTTTVLKYHEPPEARKPPPTQQWRMYVFEGKDLIDTIYLFERSCWLIGRDQKITDLHLEHTSISKQHAVIQFRYSSTTNEFGDKINRVKPYLIDLESANGTKLNGKKIADSRYVELVDSDVLSFGHSDKEYVMMLPAPDKKK